MPIVTKIYLNGNVSQVDEDVDIYQQTLTEQFNDVRLALQSEIDAKAQALGFSGGNALMLYAGFPNAFNTMATQFAEWEASVWVEAETYKQEVIAGTSPMLSTEQAVAMMPTYPS